MLDGLGIFIRRFIVQTTMGTIPVIKASIVFDNDARFSHRKEQLSIETLLAKAAMKLSMNPFCQGLPGST